MIRIASLFIEQLFFTTRRLCHWWISPADRLRIEEALRSLRKAFQYARIWDLSLAPRVSVLAKGETERGGTCAATRRKRARPPEPGLETLRAGTSQARGTSPDF